MKLKGVQLIFDNIHTLVIPKDGVNLVFKFGPIDRSDFEALCPHPVPPKVVKKGSATPVDDVTDPTYVAELAEHNKRFAAYMFLKSIAYTDGLEFETVVMGDSSTWGNYATELEKAGFTGQELVLMMQKVSAANGLNAQAIEKATDAFLASERQKAEAQ